jgi:hypothetical protein
LSGFCGAYSAGNTNSARQNTVPCYIYACSGAMVSISSCNTGITAF